MCIITYVVHENERLVLTVTSDASSYCGSVDSIAVALVDSTHERPESSSPSELTVSPPCWYIGN